MTIFCNKSTQNILYCRECSNLQDTYVYPVGNNLKYDILFELFYSILFFFGNILRGGLAR